MTVTELHPAKKYAIQLYKVWAATRSEDECFPINCIDIAEELGIKVHAEPIDDDFQGCLYIDNELKAIIYNENIIEKGRKNFTVAHELGHYLLHAGNSHLKCSIDDLNNFGDLPPHGQDIEKEANLFAASLLMPGIDVAKQIQGKLIDLNLVDQLRMRYGTSMTATACRLVEKSSRAAAVIILNNMEKVEWCWKNSHFGGFFLPKGHHVKLSNEDIHSSPISSVDLGMEWSRFDLRLSVITMPYYGKKLLFVTGH